MKTYIQALKLTWIRKFLDEGPGKWKIILKKKHPEIVKIKKYGAALLERKNINPFWNNVFKAYNNLNMKYTLKSSEQLPAEPLFFNKKFKIGKKTFHFQEWSSADIFTVGALVRRDGTFKSLNEFRMEYNINARPLDYFGYLSSIKEYMKKTSIEIKSNITQNESETVVFITGALKDAKPIYDDIMGENNKLNACEKWEKIIGDTLNWNKIFFGVNKIKETKLKWFQIKICHRILVTNSILSYMNITDSNRCNSWLAEKDTLLHYLRECPHSQKFWNDFLNLLKEKCALRQTSIKCNNSII